MNNEIQNEIGTLDDIKLRKDLVDKHPLLNPFEVVETRAIQRLNLMVERVVRLREIGLCFSAASGTGKSSAMAAAATHLNQKMPQLPVYRVNFQNKQVPSIRAFFKHFLSNVGNLSTRGETADLRDRLSKRLIIDGKQGDRDMVVLMIDEAQVMKEADFSFLKDLDNDLAMEHVQLLPILMGQEPEFSGRRAEIKRLGRLDLVGRFLIKPLRFEGLRTLDDFQLLFHNIDKSIYPSDSGWTWTRFFFQQAWDSGYRFEHETARFYSSLKTITGVKGEVPQSFAFPARQIFSAIRAFMIDNASLDGPNFAPPDTAWLSSLRYSMVAEGTQAAGNGRGQQVRIQT